MLVLKRLVGQQIVIAGTICVTVLKIRSGRVTLGIEAPATVPILRGELLEEGRDNAAPDGQVLADLEHDTPVSSSSFFPGQPR